MGSFSGISTRVLGGVVLGCALGTLALGSYGIYVSTLYFGGEKVIAHIDKCTTGSGKHHNTVCRGTWKTSEGQQHSGTVEGAGSLDEGRDVPVRATSGSAVEDSPLQLWPLAGSACCLVVTLVAGVSMVFVVRGSRCRATPYPGTYPPYRR